MTHREISELIDRDLDPNETLGPEERGRLLAELKKPQNEELATTYAQGIQAQGALGAMIKIMKEGRERSKP